MRASIYWNIFFSLSFPHSILNVFHQIQLYLLYHYGLMQVLIIEELIDFLLIFIFISMLCYLLKSIIKDDLSSSFLFYEFNFIIIVNFFILLMEVLKQVFLNLIQLFYLIDYLIKVFIFYLVIFSCYYFIYLNSNWEF